MRDIMSTSITQTQTAPALPGLRGQVSRLATALAAARKRRAIYNRTYNELASQSDRELADLGIHRSQIRSLALESAEKGTK
jgi:uncharacterized protein YjiS (DUF1127 family)